MSNANANRLKKITSEAKRIRKAHPSMSWISAVKQAGARFRGKKVGAEKRTTTVKKTVTRKTKVGAALGQKTTFQYAALSGVPHTVDVHLKHARELLTASLGKLMAQQITARTKTEKRKIGKRIADTKSRIKKLMK